jgi:hypothetical protein
MAGISWVAVPVSLIWLVNGFWVARRNEALAASMSGSRQGVRADWR